MIIGRTEELQLLDKLLLSKEAELLVIYGRRRIGKTYLINNFFKEKTLFFEWVGKSGGKMQEQLNGFPLAVRKAFGMEKVIPKPKNWDEAFDLLVEELTAYKGDEKIVLFFDELPWLCGSKLFMLRAFEHLWNSSLSKMNQVIVVLCGSAASWMIKKIVHNTKGLYGRITQKIHLQPFTLAESREYLNQKNIHLDEKQIVELYMVTGGVAKYLNHISPGLSSSQVIQELCFSNTAFLAQEFEGLFASLFEHYTRHLEVIKALSSTHYGLTHNDLATKTKISSGGTLKNTLDELEASGFIGSISFYGKNKRDARYRIIDEYTLFYLKWIEKTASLGRKSISSNYWITMQATQAYKIWCGYAFENLCFKHFEAIIETLKISVVVEAVSYWQHTQKNDGQLAGAQIDLVIKRRDRCINLCEIKFYANEFVMTQDYAHKLNQRREIFRSVTGYKGSLFNTLITPFAAKKNGSYLASIDQEVNLQSLFR